MRQTGYKESNEELVAEKPCSSQRLLPEEREIVLIMNDKERKWEASCSSPTYMRKFEKQGWKCVRTEYYRDGEVHTKFYEAPSKSSISIGKAERPKRESREISEEQLRKMQEGRKKKTANK